MTRKFYKHTVTITVLTDEPLEFEDLADLENQIDNGIAAGGFLTVKSVDLTGKEAADALYSLGSEPGFFQLNDNGEDE